MPRSKILGLGGKKRMLNSFFCPGAVNVERRGYIIDRGVENRIWIDCIPLLVGFRERSTNLDHSKGLHTGEVDCSGKVNVTTIDWH